MNKKYKYMYCKDKITTLQFSDDKISTLTSKKWASEQHDLKIYSQNVHLYLCIKSKQFKRSEK